MLMQNRREKKNNPNTDTQNRMVDIYNYKSTFHDEDEPRMMTEHLFFIYQSTEMKNGKRELVPIESQKSCKNLFICVKDEETRAYKKAWKLISTISIHKQQQ